MKISTSKFSGYMLLMSALACLIILLPAGALKAADVDLPYAGRVVYVKGKAEVIDVRGKKRLLRRGLRVYDGETVNTGSDSSLRLVMSDRSMMSLEENSSLNITSYIYKPGQPEQDVMAINVLKGSLRSLTGVIGKRNKDKFSLTTPVATMGVRGTAIEIIINPDRTVNVTFDFGSGYARNDGGTFEIGTTESARIINLKNLATSFTRPPRGDWDAASVARRIGLLDPAAARMLGKAIVTQMPRANQVLLIAMLEQVPGLGQALALSVVEGVIAADPATAPAILLTATSITRERAPVLIRTAVKAGLPAAEAFQSVVFGLVNPTQTELKAVAVEAIKAGISKEEAEKVIKNLTEGGICA